MKKRIDTSKKFKYGQKVFLKVKMLGKPKEAYIVSKDDDKDFLVKLSETFPYVAGRDKHFFINKTMLVKCWRHEKESVQVKLF